MTKASSCTPDATTGNTTAANITDKRGYGQRWKVSPRMVDNLIAQGLPHIKIGKRRVRIVINEADEWMRRQFATQRRGAVKSSQPCAEFEKQGMVNA